MKIAVVDIGSNTIKMKIFECKSNKLNEIHSEVKNTKLISYIKDGILSSEGIFKLCEAVCEFKEHAKKQNTDHFSCFATASLRRTKNIEETVDAVFTCSSEKIDLVSGADEAFYSFSGVKNTMENFPGDAILFDMGGGSTEIVRCNNGERTSSDSMNFGSLSLYLDHPNNDFEAMQTTVINALKSCKVFPVQSNEAVLVGGTALAINTLYRHFYSDCEPYKMTYDRLLSMYNKLKSYDDETVALLKEKVPHRITTAISGLSAYVAMLDQCGVKNITVSTCGIREGYVFEKILKNLE